MFRENTRVESVLTEDQYNRSGTDVGISEQ